MGNRKLPFGYKMVMGEIVVHPQEAQAVQGIYARYLAGASFNDITDHLKEKGPPYDADKPWNKNMVARILEDSRYTGTDRFPAILDADQMKETTQRRSERKPAVQITEAQKTLRRLCNGRPSTAVESQVLSLLNGLTAAPEQIKPQPQTVNVVSWPKWSGASRQRLPPVRWTRMVPKSSPCGWQGCNIAPSAAASTKASTCGICSPLPHRWRRSTPNC